MGRIDCHLMILAFLLILIALIGYNLTLFYEKNLWGKMAARKNILKKTHLLVSFP